MVPVPGHVVSSPVTAGCPEFAPLPRIALRIDCAVACTVSLRASCEDARDEAPHLQQKVDASREDGADFGDRPAHARWSLLALCYAGPPGTGAPRAGEACHSCPRTDSGTAPFSLEHDWPEQRLSDFHTPSSQSRPDLPGFGHPAGGIISDTHPGDGAGRCVGCPHPGKSWNRLRFFRPWNSLFSNSGQRRVWKGLERPL